MNILSRLISILFILPGFIAGQSITPTIRLNQLGFYPHAPKVAVVLGDIQSAVFFVVKQGTGDTVFKGNLGDPLPSRNSSLRTRMAVFSSMQQPGTYTLLVPGLPKSYPFFIKAGVHHPLAIASLKGFYYQRVSMPLDPRYAGKWARPAGHPDTAVLVHPSAASPERPAGTKISCPGGWYDAGDYNKYVVNSGISMGTLLSAYEDFPAYFDSLHTNIPESDNSIPDILDEILYNLRWMLDMQDPGDGGVYNKCTNAAFDGMVMPGVTKLPRYVVQKGTAATLDFAAVTAQAARVFSKWKVQLPGLADSCLEASRKAWEWAEKNPSVVYDQNAMNQKFEPKITTGGYGDNNFADEWFWAACELLLTTNGHKFHAVVESRMGDSLQLPSWNNVYALGCYTLLRFQKKLGDKAGADLMRLRNKILFLADDYLKQINANAFGTVMGQSRRDFIWGSNAVAANQGVLLVNAYLITRDKKYMDAALTNLDYLMGRNATGFCFVTGIGSKSPLHPHHRPSVSDGIAEPVPGLMAGGPNPGMQDHCHYDFTEPETAYADIDCAYASNEIAINWNAPLVYLANAIEALQYELGYDDQKN
jgi:endoglucanase